MEIRETLFTKGFSLETDSGFVLSMDLMKKLSENYMIYERESKYMTDGPVKKSIVNFDIIETIDEFSRVLISVSMEAENNTLYVTATGSLILKLSDIGPFSSMFSEFYLSSVFPIIRKTSEKRAKELEAYVESI